MRISHRYCLFAAVAFVVAAGIARPGEVVASIMFELDTEFSGATEPAGTPPWLTATFDDSIGGGKVRLTMSTTALTGVEFVPAWYFNLNPALNPSLLAFTPINVAAVSSVTVSKGLDAFKADGDGYFDIRFSFPESDNRLTALEAIVFDISYGGAGTFNENAFNFGSAPGGGNGTWYSAAKVQGIGASGANSGWIGAGPGEQVVPEATSLIIWSLLAGAAILCVSRRSVMGAH